MEYKIYDISVTVKNKMLKWPTDPEVHIEKLLEIDKKDKLNFSKINFGAHTGTHIDAPFHFYNKGKKIHNLNLYDLIGEVIVINVLTPKIDKKFLKTIDLKKYKRIIFKTQNSKKKLLSKKNFTKNYVYITKDGAKYLAAKKIKLIGIDYLSIEDYNSKNSYAHKIITKNDIIILETLDLSKVIPGKYLLIALPIKLYGTDGAPARIVLIKFNNEK